MHKGVLTLAAIAAAFALPAVAQSPDATTTPAPTEATTPAPEATAPAAAEMTTTEVFIASQGDGQYLAKDLLLGAKVQNAEGQIVGDIEDLILNADNQVEGVIMGVGGFAGFGEKRIAVSLPALQIAHTDGNVTVKLPQATKETLDALPAFERKTPPKSLMDRAIEKAKELSDKGKVTATDAYNKAKEEAGPALERAQEAAKKAYEDVKEKAGPALESAKEATKDAYDSARDSLTTKEETPAAEAPPAGDPPPPEPIPAADAPGTASDAAPETTPAPPPAAETPAETPAEPPATQP
jgi:sporulation protein YlmC with PRC-barrel domain